MKTIISLLSISVLACFMSACATGENSNSHSYSTVIGDITIVDNGGTATTTKTADLSVSANKKAADKVSAKADK